MEISGNVIRDGFGFWLAPPAVSPSALLLFFRAEVVSSTRFAVDHQNESLVPDYLMDWEVYKSFCAEGLALESFVRAEEGLVDGLLFCCGFCRKNGRASDDRFEGQWSMF